jgi:hypothetical protein
MRFPILRVLVLVGLGASIAYPRTIFLFPVVRFSHAWSPRRTLLEPVERPYPARYPKRELLEKELPFTPYPAPYPIAVLYTPVVLKISELTPLAVLDVPVVLDWRA